jgi:hypothetical protein
VTLRCVQSTRHLFTYFDSEPEINCALLRSKSCLVSLPLSVFPRRRQRATTVVNNRCPKARFCLGRINSTRGLGKGIPIQCYGWPVVASGQADMVVRVEMERWVLNHAKVLDTDGCGDIPLEWCVSVLLGARICRSGIHSEVPIPKRALRLGGRSKSIMNLPQALLYLFCLLSFGTRALLTQGGFIGAASKVQRGRRGP